MGDDHRRPGNFENALGGRKPVGFRLPPAADGGLAIRDASDSFVLRRLESMPKILVLVPPPPLVGVGLRVALVMPIREEDVLLPEENGEWGR